MATYNSRRRLLLIAAAFIFVASMPVIFGILLLGVYDTTRVSDLVAMFSVLATPSALFFTTFTLTEVLRARQGGCKHLAVTASRVAAWLSIPAGPAAFANAAVKTGWDPFWVAAGVTGLLAIGTVWVAEGTHRLLAESARNGVDIRSPNTIGS